MFNLTTAFEVIPWTCWGGYMGMFFLIGNFTINPLVYLVLNRYADGTLHLGDDARANSYDCSVKSSSLKGRCLYRASPASGNATQPFSEWG